MIHNAHGNLLTAEADALVNTVNCVGVMGKGIALQFKQAFPALFSAYKAACDQGEVRPGRMFVWETGEVTPPRFVINFPTKRHWKGHSQLPDIEAGLVALVDEVRQRGIRTIAIPPLGCGAGGLDWAQVRPLIETAFAPLPAVDVLLYEPNHEPSPAERVNRTPRPQLTRARALLIKSMKQYAVLAYETTQLEIQKLAYFLQAAGEDLKLRFEKQHYGPYADNLSKVLEVLEGHFIEGFDGDRSPAKVISLRAGAAEAATEFLRADADATARTARLGALIEGFEMPYGMEVLASVHWVAEHDEPPARTPAEAVAAVHGWNPRKAKIIAPRHVEKAWDRLEEQGWIGAVSG